MHLCLTVYAYAVLVKRKSSDIAYQGRVIRHIAETILFPDKQEKKHNERSFDFIQDAPYIYAAYRQAYGRARKAPLVGLFVFIQRLAGKHPHDGDHQNPHTAHAKADQAQRRVPAGIVQGKAASGAQGAADRAGAAHTGIDGSICQGADENGAGIRG